MVARVAVPSGPHPAAAAPDAAGVGGLLYAPCVALSYHPVSNKNPGPSTCPGSCRPRPAPREPAAAFGSENPEMTVAVHGVVDGRGVSRRLRALTSSRTSRTFPMAAAANSRTLMGAVNANTQLAI